MRTKYFITWLVLTIAAFAFISKDKISENSTAVNQPKPTEPVVIVVDHSYSMINNQKHIQEIIKQIASKYTQVAIVKSSSSKLVFSDNRELGRFKAYGPINFRHLLKIESQKQVQNVDKYLITTLTVNDYELERFPNWKVITVATATDNK